MLELCSSEHNIELSVKKDIVIHRAPKDHGQFICILDMDNNPSYVNGIVKHMIVRKSFIRCELIKKIHRNTKINPSEHQLHLTCKWPVSHENYQTVGISYDDDCHALNYVRSSTT